MFTVSGQGTDRFTVNSTISPLEYLNPVIGLDVFIHRP